jgi:hypothetical protein
MGLYPTKPRHEMFYQDLCKLMRRYDALPAEEILAIAANMVGKILAMQDQRRITPAMGLEIISRNIEEGNRQVLAELGATKGSA